MARLLPRFLALCGLLLAAMGSAGCGLGPEMRGPGSAASGAEAYYRETVRLLDEVERDLPRITRTADAAARPYVENADVGLAADGLPVFCSEGVGRSGGIMAIGAGWPMQKATWNGVVLYCLRPERLEDDFKRIAIYHERGCRVVLFGTPEMLAKASAADVRCEATVTVPASEHLGLLPDAGGRWVVGTYEMGAMCALWPWVGEFVAACTRRGRMPAMFQSIAVPTGAERMKKYSLKGSAAGLYVKFHDEKPPAIAEGRLAREWLASARKRLGMLHERQTENILLAAARAAQARKDGRGLWAIFTGHAPPLLPSSPQDPHYFQDAGPPWEAWNRAPDKAPKPQVRKGDFVLGIGYHSVFNGDDFHHFADFVRQSGARAAWCAATYRPEETRTVAGEIFIDAQWEYGDADVTVPGYDIRILPTSGVLAAEVYLMINAQVHRQLAAGAPAGAANIGTQPAKAAAHDPGRECASTSPAPGRGSSCRAASRT